jgi:hypothetical protein
MPDTRLTKLTKDTQINAFMILVLHARQPVRA